MLWGKLRGSVRKQYRRSVWANLRKIDRPKGPLWPSGTDPTRPHRSGYGTQWRTTNRHSPGVVEAVQFRPFRQCEQVANMFTHTAHIQRTRSPYATGHRFIVFPHKHTCKNDGFYRHRARRSHRGRSLACCAHSGCAGILLRPATLNANSQKKPDNHGRFNRGFDFNDDHSAGSISRHDVRIRHASGGNVRSATAIIEAP